MRNHLALLTALLMVAPPSSGGVPPSAPPKRGGKKGKFRIKRDLERASRKRNRRH